MGVRVLGQRPQPAFYMYHADTVLGWKILHRISYAAGEKKVARGSMRRVLDQAGNHIGYQPVATAAMRVDIDLPSRPQPVTITARQSEDNAYTLFADGRSRTAGMTEERRMERVARKLDPEDAMERLQAKIAVYAHIGGAKGDILRVWPRNAAQPLNAELLAAGA